MSEHNTRGLPSEHIVCLPLHVLTKRQRMIIVMHYAQGWTLTEVADAIGVSKQAVSRSHRDAIRNMARTITVTGEHSTLTRNRTP